MAERISFATDHHDGPHPRVRAARDRAENGRQPSYGNDPLTREVKARFKDIFGPTADMHLVAGGGTAANAMAMARILPSEGALVCSVESHMANDERGAIGRATGGAEVLTLQTGRDAKIKPHQLAEFDYRKGVVHWSEPAVLSITQPTERGTLYKIAEIKALAEAAHERDMLFQMDGARLFHGAAALDMPFREFTTDVGVDVVTFGAAKNGGLGVGEAVVFLKDGLGENFPGILKQAGHLSTKSRSLASQWEELLGDDNLGVNLAQRTNEAMHSLAEQTADAMQLPSETSDSSSRMTRSYEVQANGMWVRFQTEWDIASLEELYVFNRQAPPHRREARFMTSYTTEPREVDRLAGDIIYIAER